MFMSCRKGPGEYTYKQVEKKKNSINKRLLILRRILNTIGAWGNRFGKQRRRPRRAFSGDASAPPPI